MPRIPHGRTDLKGERGAPEITITGRDAGKITRAAGYSSHGEPVRRRGNKSGSVREVWLAASRLRLEKRVAADMLRLYQRGTRAKAKRR
jgi:hypothetical protein